MLKQGGHSFFVSPHDCFMKSRKAGPGRVWIRTLLEQEPGEISEPGMFREGRGADSPRIFIVYFGSGSDQEFR